MVSFTQNLENLRRGYISFDDLLTDVNHIIAADHANATWLLAKFREEEANNPLPADVCNTLLEKLEPLAQKRIHISNAAKENSNSVSYDIEGSQLAHAIQPNSIQASETKENTPDVIALNDDNEIDQKKRTDDVLKNRFELQEKIGSGGMSDVYKAIDRRKLKVNDHHPYVAVQALNLGFRSHPDSFKALRRQIKKCRSLVHPNIVQVYNFNHDGATVYITTEYLSAVSLERKMRDSYFTGIPRDEALRIINDAGQALSFAHKSGMVHADFKPSNVLITDVGRIKVNNFGIARALQHDHTVAMQATGSNPGLLKALIPIYASPQLLEHLKPNPRDDVYALACTAYEMLTGHHPFRRLPASAARKSGLKLPRHKALAHYQYLALKRALDFDRDKRTATIEQFLKEIDQIPKTIGKKATTVGLIGLVVGISASYYYLSSPKEEIVASIRSRNSQSTTNASIETGPLVSSATSADSNKIINQERAIEQDSPPPLPASTDFDSKFDLKFWESIKDNGIADYQAYLETFPKGRNTFEARVQVARLTQRMKTSPALPQPGDADVKKPTPKKKVARLLKLAASHFKAERLMAPKFDNALFTYLKILKLDAENPDAQAGIKRIKAKLLSYVSVAQAQNDLETARSQLNKILVIDPQDDAARAVLEKLQ